MGHGSFNHFNDHLGAIAQLGERLNGIQEAGGSIPPSSTNNIKDLATYVKSFFCSR